MRRRSAHEGLLVSAVLLLGGCDDGSYAAAESAARFDTVALATTR